jgi:SMODS and SLOG-associating 2TM effector domain family 4
MFNGDSRGRPSGQSARKGVPVSETELKSETRALKSQVETYRSAHFRASDHLRVWHYIIGFLLIFVSAVVSGSVLQATGEDPSHGLTLAAGILSIAVVVLTSVQTTFKLGERSELHRSAAAGFGRIGRILDAFIHRPHPNVDESWRELLAIADDISKVEAGAPGFLGFTYRRALREMQRRQKSAASA